MSPGCLAGPPGDYLQRLRERVSRVLLTRDVSKYFAQKLYSSVDGLALSKSNEIPRQHDWINASNRFISGKDYINLIKTRINCLALHPREAPKGENVSRGLQPEGNPEPYLSGLSSQARTKDCAS
ncbi:hypothetical protein AVEN_207124-1 [Araneus ventricosus]|uniref:Uncharacterized protein n=1 Tax=Araneus ventricosus TaxID=182803 RepID=A0A4Y2JGP7_ARAVE|nr:hypothetical protein AVEN_207124-1 [Araneus ventricosus]